MMGKGAWVAEPWGFLSNDWTQHVNPLRDSSQAPGIIIVVGHSSVEDHTSDQLERIWCAWRQVVYIEIQRL